jgi:hypothetical protein
MPISRDSVLSHPVRRAALEHVADCGGWTTAMSIRDALGESRRGCVSNHLLRLCAFGLARRRIALRRGRRGVRALEIAITPNGRAALDMIGGPIAPGQLSNARNSEVSAP